MELISGSVMCMMGLFKQRYVFFFVVESHFKFECFCSIQWIVDCHRYDTNEYSYTWIGLVASIRHVWVCQWWFLFLIIILAIKSRIFACLIKVAVIKWMFPLCSSPLRWFAYYCAIKFNTHKHILHQRFHSNRQKSRTKSCPMDFFPPNGLRGCIKPQTNQSFSQMPFWIIKSLLWLGWSHICFKNNS